MTKVDISSLDITNINEINEEWRDWFYFDVDGTKYRIILTAVFGSVNANAREIGFVVHVENYCLFCGPGAIENQVCTVLNQHAKELIHKVIEQSKNRLRWITRVML